VYSDINFSLEYIPNLEIEKSDLYEPRVKLNYIVKTEYSSATSCRYLQNSKQQNYRALGCGRISKDAARYWIGHQLLYRRRRAHQLLPFCEVLLRYTFFDLMHDIYCSCKSEISLFYLTIGVYLNLTVRSS
jgi:hypothetical protein